MDTSALVISLAIIVHLLGIFLIIFNSIYLAYTRRINSARGHGKMFCCKQRNIKRRFKIKFDKAWNLLVLYHITLIFVDLIMVVVCEEVDKLNYQIDSFHNLVDMFWISAIINYGVVFMLNVLYLVGLKTVHRLVFNRHSYVFGHLHQFNCFGFINFLVFWTSVLLLLTCAGIDCEELPGPWKSLARGLGLVSLAISYVCMVVESVYAEKWVILDGKGTTKREALSIIRRKLLETTSTMWVVECGEVVTTGKMTSILF